MQPLNRHQFKNRIAANFGQKVNRYAKNAVVQQKLLSMIVPKILSLSRPEQKWVDFGCGNGDLENRLIRQEFPAFLTGFDIALDSLKFCRKHGDPSISWICADIEHVPLKPASFNGIIASSVLQWTRSLTETFKMVSHLLKPEGIFIFAMFSEGSFRELTEMQKKFNLPSPVILPEKTMILAMLKAQDFICRDCEPFSETLYFPSAFHLLQHLGSIGSTNMKTPPLTRSRLMKFCAEFENTYATDLGIPLTYEAIAGTARKGVCNV